MVKFPGVSLLHRPLPYLVRRWSLNAVGGAERPPQHGEVGKAHIYVLQRSGMNSIIYNIIKTCF